MLTRPAHALRRLFALLVFLGMGVWLSPVLAAEHAGPELAAWGGLDTTEYVATHGVSDPAPAAQPATDAERDSVGFSDTELPDADAEIVPATVALFHADTHFLGVCLMEAQPPWPHLPGALRPPTRT